MLNRNFLRVIAISLFVFTAILLHAGTIFGQHPCDAFVNTCNVPSFSAWTVNDTIQISTGEAAEPVSHTFYTLAQNPLTTNWYHWTAPLNGMIVVNTQGTNPNAAPPNYQTPYVTDTVIAAYTGATLGTLTRASESDDWQPSTGNNSSCTFSRPIPESIFSSCMMFTVTAGTTYHFQVDHLEIPTTAANSNFVLNLYYRAPTSATVSIGGQVLDGGGRSLARVFINLVKPNGETISAYTNSFGFYRFDGIETGQTVILKAVAKKYQFQNNPRVLNVGSDVQGEDFIAETAPFVKLE